MRLVERYWKFSLLLPFGLFFCYWTLIEANTRSFISYTVDIDHNSWTTINTYCSSYSFLFWFSLWNGLDMYRNWFWFSTENNGFCEFFCNIFYVNCFIIRCYPPPTFEHMVYEWRVRLGLFKKEIERRYIIMSWSKKKMMNISFGGYIKENPGFVDIVICYNTWQYKQKRDEKPLYPMLTHTV